MVVGLYGVLPDGAVTAGSIVVVGRLAREYLDSFFLFEKKVVQYDDVLVQGNH